MVKIEFETDNAAFEGENFGPEVARILRAFALTIERGQYVDNWPVRDANGNTVGRAKIWRD
jgi:hypothetical protein